MSRYSFKAVVREEKKRAAELARRLKAHAKQNELEMAKEAVEEFEAQIAELQSMHRQCSEPPDWLGFASSLPPCPPPVYRSSELAARNAQFLLGPLEMDPPELPDVASAMSDDRIATQAIQEAFRIEAIEQKSMAQLARGVLAQDPGAYLQALNENPSLAELGERGSRLVLTCHSPHVIECVLSAHTSEVVPAEVKSLTSTGKLSTRAMPRAQFMALYQDYLCSCVLRIGREVFSILPVASVIISVVSRDGSSAEVPIISVILSRGHLQGLEFDTLDPSDAVETFSCRTDFKASRKSGSFSRIIPFEGREVPLPLRGASIGELLTQARVLIDELE